MGTLSELLRWKKEVALTDEAGKPIKDEHDKELRVWVRIIGDHDLQEAYKMARVVSAEMRGYLRDVDHPEYKDKIEPFKTADKDECVALIKASRGNSWLQEALSTVVRPELVKIREIAIDPDAPTLEEQEKLDRANAELDQKYQDEVNEFVAQKDRELDAELNDMILDQMRIIAQVETSVMLPLTAFMHELEDQKIWRSVYLDQACKQRGFSDASEYRDMLAPLRNQIIEAYNELETGHADIKN